MDRPLGFITKLLAPRLSRTFLRRQRLVDFLYQNLHRKLQLVCAPAGYGKTSLLTDFAADSQYPTCWFTLDPMDRDPARFLNYLVEAIGMKFPGFGEQTRALLSGELSSQDTITALGTLVSEIYSSVPDCFLLILDNYYHVDGEPEVNSLVGTLIEHAPDNCRIIIASRTVPQIPNLSRLISQREVAGLGMNDLRFTAAEIQELFQRFYSVAITPEEAERLTTNSEGWITAILLTSQTLWKGLPRDVMGRGGSGPLFDYLAAEVLHLQPQEVQEFLLTTSILSALTPGRCDALLERKDSARCLEEIAQRCLLLTPLDSEAPCYRYHPLFQEFLRSRLKARNTRDYYSLHLKAARYYQEAGEAEEAIGHYLEAQEYGAARALIQERAEALFKEGKWRTLSRWVDALPGELQHDSGELLYWRASVATQMGDPDMALRLLDRAQEIFRSSGERIWLAQALLARSTALRFQGNYEPALKDIQEALALVKRDNGHPALLARIHRHLGATYGHMGRLHQAREELEKALTICRRRGDTYQTANLETTLGVLYERMGDLDRATAHHLQARLHWERLGNKGELALVLNNLGVTYYLQGNYQMAQETLEEALARAEESGNRRIKAYALNSLGDLKRDLGAYSQALELYQKGLEEARLSLEANLVAYATAAMAETYRLMGEREQAEELARQAVAQAEAQGQNYALGLYLTILGSVAAQGGNYPEAIETLERACGVLESSGSKMELCRAGFRLAQALFLDRKYGQALEQLKRVSGLLEEMGHHRFLRVEAERSPMLVQYALSKGVGGKAFRQLAEGLGVEEAPSRPQTVASTAAAQAPEVQVYCFGKSRVVLNSRVVEESRWRSEKAREMFFYLLHRNGWLTREEIIEALWPDTPPAKGNSNFHTTAYRLRRALYPDCLLHEDGRYRLNPSWRYWVDVWEFEEMLKQAQALPRGDRERAKCLEQAISFYRGSFLEDFYSEWCETRRRDLEEKYLRALYSLAGYYEAKGEREKSLELLEKVIAVDPFQDEAHYLVIRAHLKAGDVASASCHLRRYRELLQSELGVDLPARFKRLYQKYAEKDHEAVEAG